MNLLSRKTDYALLILSYLHHHSDGGCARTIADHYNLSRGFIANILKELCQKGFVVSQRGVKGGYLLQRPAEEINLSELLQSLEEGLRLTSCTGHPHENSEENCSLVPTCPIKAPIGELHRRILDVLAKISLAEILQPISSNKPNNTFQPILSTISPRDLVTTGTR
jgi:Rrf2 family transcriptional regulator, cysteine metabolism repressor